jgi:phosphoglycerate dehydrogenase-like enzyme
MANRTIYLVSKLCSQEFVDILAQKLPKSVTIKRHEFNIKTDGFVRDAVELINDKDIEQLQDAEIVIADNNLFHYFVYSLPRLQWLQGTFAGVNVTFDKIRDELENKGQPRCQATRFTGEKYGQLMHEYCLSYIIGHERGFRQHQILQNTKDWAAMLDKTPKQYRLLSDLKIGILGIGAIGSQVSKLFKSNGVKEIHAYGRTQKTPEYLKESGVDMFSTNLADVLKDVDYIVSILPHTPETIGLLDGQFKHCTKSPGFINLGRGSVVAEREIIAALDAGHLSLAVLDVYQKEPLPTESDLWTHPLVAMTPHIAACTRPQDLAEVVADNFIRFVNGEELRFKINWEDGY